MTAAELLKGYLEANEVTYEAAGKELRVTRQTIWAWLKHGSVPSEGVKLKIEEWTKGEVPASSWPTVDRRKPEEPAA